MNYAAATAPSADAADGTSDVVALAYPPVTDDVLRRVLALTAGPWEDLPVMWWSRMHQGVDGLRLSVDCSDFFEWGTADSESVTAANIEVLEAACADVAAALAGVDLTSKYAADPTSPNSSAGPVGSVGSVGLWSGREGFSLFCARMRGMRPQGAAYDGLHSVTWPLFDAAGPPRERDVLNPRGVPAVEQVAARLAGRGPGAYFAGLCDALDVASALDGTPGQVLSVGQMRQLLSVVVEDPDAVRWRCVPGGFVASALAWDHPGTYQIAGVPVTAETVESWVALTAAGGPVADVERDLVLPLVSQTPADPGC